MVHLTRLAGAGAAGCIIVSFTTPITMHLYSVVADRADARAAAAAETASPAGPGAGAAAKQPSVELISHQDGQNYLGLKPRQYGCMTPTPPPPPSVCSAAHVSQGYYSHHCVLYKPAPILLSGALCSTKSYQRRSFLL